MSNYYCLDSWASAGKFFHLESGSFVIVRSREIQPDSADKCFGIRRAYITNDGTSASRVTTESVMRHNNEFDTLETTRIADQYPSRCVALLKTPIGRTHE